MTAGIDPVDFRDRLRAFDRSVDFAEVSPARQGG